MYGKTKRSNPCLNLVVSFARSVKIVGIQKLDELSPGVLIPRIGAPVHRDRKRTRRRARINIAHIFLEGSTLL